jgi:hypothetical protein
MPRLLWRRHRVGKEFGMGRTHHLRVRSYKLNLLSLWPWTNQL